MIQYNIDFFGLTETCHQLGQRYKLQSHLLFTAYWSICPNRHARVGIVLHRKWCIYVQHVFLQHDWFIYLDFFFKGHVKLCIIVTYIHAHPLDQPHHVKLQHQLMNLINFSISSSYQVIIMEDFNINLDYFYTATTSSSSLS